MSKRGENIYKRKDERWEGRYVKCRTLHGKIQYGYIYGKSYSETKAKLKENASTPIRASSSQATQSALYDEVLKAWLLSSKNRVKESTFSRYNHLVARHIQPLLGSYPISEISTVLLEECIDYLLQNGRLDGNGGLSPKSVSDIIVVMKSSIRYALGNGYLVSCSPTGLSSDSQAPQSGNQPVEHTIVPDGLAADIPAMCEAYEHQIEDWGGVDIQLLGLGHDGHIGFNEPCDHFPVMTHEVKLTEMTREANKRFFDSLEDVPTSAITMGIGTVMSARKILMIVTGADKAEILHQVFFGSVKPEVPGSILQFHPDVTVICDEAAARFVEE